MIFYYDLLWKRTLQIKNAHGWVSFLFLFLDCLSRLFSPHRCTAYYVCQYNKVFAKLMSKSNVIDVTSQAGENTQSHYLENISICRIYHRRPPFRNMIRIYIGMGWCCYPTKYFNHVSSEKSKVKDDVFKPGSVSSASSRKFPAGLEWHSEKQTWVGFLKTFYNFVI